MAVALWLSAVCILSSRCGTVYVVEASRLSCPHQFICECKSIKIYPRQAVTENRIDCRERSLQEVPELARANGLPISSLLLAHNHITSIANGTFQDMRLINAHRLSPIPVLDLSFNPLEHLPEAGLEGLVANRLSLRLNNCSLVAWPSLPEPLAAVTVELYLKNNLFLSVPHGALVAFHELKLLDLTGNEHMSLVAGSLQGLEDALEVLYLEEMKLSSVPIHVLQPLRALRYLYLTGNQITHLPDYIFSGFACGELTVDLSDNSMVQVAPDALRRHPNTSEHIPVLKTLFLDDNGLRDLDFLMDPCSLLVGNHSTLGVRNNPIRCGCFLYNVTRYRVVEVLGHCAEPAHYAGASLDGYMKPEPLVGLLQQTPSIAQKFGVSHPGVTAPKLRAHRGSFLQEAQEECGPQGPKDTGGADSRLHKQFSCACKTWKPRVQRPILAAWEPELAAEAQVQELCSRATTQGWNLHGFRTLLLISLILPGILQPENSLLPVHG